MQASAAFAIEEEQEDFDEEMAEVLGEGLEKIKGYLKKVEKEYGYMDEELAVVALGDCYREGKEGVEQDDEKAVLCYEEATEYDCIDGVQMLGVCVFEGRGIEQDYEEAFSLLSREYMKGGGGCSNFPLPRPLLFQRLGNGAGLRSGFQRVPDGGEFL